MNSKILDKSDLFSFTEDINQLSNKKVFHLEHKNEIDNIDITFPFDFKDQDPGYKDSKIDIYILDGYKKNESSIYKIKDKKENIFLGWIVPLASLSEEFDNETISLHFVNTIYLLYITLLKSKIVDSNLENFIEKIKSQEFLTLEDMFGTGKQVLIIFEKAKERYESGFNINQFIPALYEYGYYFSMFDNKEHNIKEINKEKYDYLSLVNVSEPLREDVFLHAIFQEKILTTENEINRFYILYQAIELLVNKVHFYELKRICDNHELKENTFFKIQDKLHSNYGEKLINKLVTEYVNISEVDKSVFEELKNSIYNDCRRISNLTVETTKETGFSDELYSTRNILFHAYHAIYKNDITETLEKINLNLESLLLIIVRTFKVPNFD